MASAAETRERERFLTISEEDIEALLESTTSENSKKAVKYSVRILNEFCETKGLNLEAAAASKVELNRILKTFYAAARTQKNDLYSKKSMLSIRYGIQKHFEKCSKIDTINDEDFKESNKVFSAMLVQVKKAGKAEVLHKNPLSKEDLRLLYSSFDLESPKGLQDKVFVDIMLYFCNRGRENIRELKRCDFIVEENEQYIKMRDRATKNHRGNIQDSQKSQGGRIYKSENNILCPFTSFMKYLSVLNPACEAFFQRPKPKEHIKNPSVWYDNSPLGKNTLGNKMKTLSADYRLSRQYTNHCLRATTITLLDIFEARHVMTVSGHKSADSIRDYARTNDEQLQRMAFTILDTVTGNNDHGHSDGYSATGDTTGPLPKSTLTAAEKAAIASRCTSTMVQSPSENGNADPGHGDGYRTGVTETLTSAKSTRTAPEKSALASTCKSTMVQPPSENGSDDFGLGFEFTASQETTLMSDIPDMIAKDWGIPPGNTCDSTQLVEPAPRRVFSSSRQMSSSIKHSAPIYIQNSTVHFH